jgi:glycosyltransferase involved in cell wall biosynthesis
MQRDIALFADLVSLARLWWLLLRLRPDIAEFSTPKAGLLGNIAARLAGVPARVYMLRGLKLETSNGIKKAVLLASERAASTCAQVVLCNSQSMRSEALALGIAPAPKLRLIGDGSSNGVDVERFCPGPSRVRSLLGLPANAPVLGFVGRLTTDKGVPELIEAFDAILKREPEAHLLLVGWFDVSEDALPTRWRDRIVNHPRICCTGFVPDTAPYYRAMDVMVLPSWREGFPNVVLEAAATGIPVITTESTGSRDSVLPEVTGLLIPPGYPEAISEAVLKLLCAPERRQMMGDAARAWVCRHFSDERVLRLAVSFYQSLLNPAPWPGRVIH